MMVRLVGRCLVGGFLMLSPQFANAQGTTLPPSAISAFLANPNQLLSQFPNGGPDMARQISSLLGTDKTLLGPIIALARTATEDQRKTMAAALAQVAKSNAASDPAFANQIQLAVASSGIPEFAKAYAEAAGDTGTASTGGGGGGGGGGPNTAGAPQGGSNFGTFNPGNSFTPNTTPNLLTGGALGGGGFSQVSAH